jgi:hypothetical protein
MLKPSPRKEKSTMSEMGAITIWTRLETDGIEQFAAHEMQRYLQQMSGQEIVSQLISKAPSFPAIYLALGSGKLINDWPALSLTLPGDGYRLLGDRTGIALISPTSRGLLYAVYGLLKHLGARWYFPGPAGEMIPHLSSIEIGNLDITDAPVIDQRGVILRGTDRYLPEWVDFAPKIGLNAICVETQQGIHRLPKLVGDRGLHMRLRRHFYSTTFCSQDERTLRYQETLSKGCILSVPKEIDSIQLRPADSFGARCMCPVDREYSLADQVLRFTNRMAKAIHGVRPHQEVPYVAYQSTWCPPPSLDPGPGVTLSMGVIHRCFNHAIDDPSCAINSPVKYPKPMGHFEYGVRPIIEQLLQKFDPGNCFLVDYVVDSSLFAREQMTPWHGRLPNNGAVIQRDIQYYHRVGIPSIWSFVIFVDDRYMQRFISPLIYQWGNLLWNPDCDLRAGLRDFCLHYLGNSSLEVVFPLEELSDPRDATKEQWQDQMDRIARADAIVREAKADTHNEQYNQRLTLLAAEQQHCLRAIYEQMKDTHWLIN